MITKLTPHKTKRILARKQLGTGTASKMTILVQKKEQPNSLDHKEEVFIVFTNSNAIKQRESLRAESWIEQVDDNAQ